MTNSLAGYGGSSLSPDALLEYCQMQLGDVDSQTQAQIDLQNQQLNERTAVENVQTTLESFGDQGPTTGDDMAKCVAAFQQAIASLPSGDPIAAQLTTQMTAMENQYQYAPGYMTSQTPDPTVGTAAAAAQAAKEGSPQTTPSAPSTASTTTTYVAPTIGSPPANDDWKGTVDALGNLADGIKSQSEIEMLSLQDLVSEQQQVVELSTGMMTKEDQTLEDGAKAIGQ